MKDILTVFQFTFLDGLRKKAFKITTVIVMLLIVAGCSIPFFMSGSGGESGQNEEQYSGGGGQTEGTAAEGSDISASQTCYYIDENQVIPGGLDGLQSVYPSIKFVEGAAGQLEEYKEQVKDDSTRSVLLVSEQNGQPFLSFYTKDFMSGVSADSLAQTLKTVRAAGILTAQGVAMETVGSVLADIPYSSEIVGKMDLSGYILGIVLTMIMFFAVYFYGYGVSMSVASEKTSRVMETLVVSAKPSRILVGKCIGMGILGLAQLCLFLLTGAVCFQLMVPKDFTIMGMPLALTAFTPASAVLVLVYFLLGYSLFAMFNSVCGATVSRAEDLQSAMMPVSLIAIVSFYAAYIAMFTSTGPFKKIATYIPFTSPFIMPYRLLNEDVPGIDIAVSLLLLVVVIVLVSIVSIRLYTISVLHYGQRLKIKDLFSLKS